MAADSSPYGVAAHDRIDEACCIGSKLKRTGAEKFGQLCNQQLLLWHDRRIHYASAQDYKAIDIST